MKNLFDQYNAIYNFSETKKTVAHMGRSVVVSQFSFQNEGRGRKSSEIVNIEAFLEAYNQSLVAEAKLTIEKQIAAEKEAANAKEQQLLDRIAELENKTVSDKEKEANSIQRRKDRTTKVVVGFGLSLMIMVLIVGVYMNHHNLAFLFGKIIPNAAIWIFAFVISFIVFIFAYMQSKKHTMIASTILPIDFIIAILLHIFFNETFQQSNPNWYKAILTVFGVVYAAQIWITLDELKKIMLDRELRTKFFDVLFTKW